MTIDLPFPHKILWPNGRTRSTGWRASEFKKHKEWARLATLEAFPIPYRGSLRSQVISHGAVLTFTVHPKTRNLIDDDNAGAAMKAYRDGIAAALSLDDNLFTQAPVQFGEPIKGGKVRVRIGDGQ